MVGKMVVERAEARKGGGQDGFTDKKGGVFVLSASITGSAEKSPTMIPLSSFSDGLSIEK